MPGILTTLYSGARPTQTWLGSLRALISWRSLLAAAAGCFAAWAVFWRGRPSPRYAPIETVVVDRDAQAPPAAPARRPRKQSPDPRIGAHKAVDARIPQTEQPSAPAPEWENFAAFPNPARPLPQQTDPASLSLHQAPASPQTPPGSSPPWTLVEQPSADRDDFVWI